MSDPYLGSCIAAVRAVLDQRMAVLRALLLILYQL